MRVHTTPRRFGRFPLLVLGSCLLALTLATALHTIAGADEPPSTGAATDAKATGDGKAAEPPIKAGTTADTKGRAAADATAPKTTLVLGVISSDAKASYAALKPMAEYTASRMKDLGIERGEAIVAKTTRQMMEYLRTRKVDWVSDTIYPALLLEERGTAKITLRRWKQATSEYHSAFIVRKDSEIESIADFRGRTIAFESPDSTTAYFLPAIELMASGLDLYALDSLRDTPPPGYVGYVFAKHEINQSTWVHKGLVAGAAYSNHDWSDEKSTPAAFRYDLSILHRSRCIPRSVTLVRTGLAPAIEQRLRRILLEAADDSEAKLALEAYDRTSKFDELGEHDRAAIEEARSLLPQLRGELTNR